MNKILFGLLAGLTIGILIAPGKGTETRRRLVDGFNDFTEDLADDAHDIYASGKSLIDEVKADTQDLASSFKDTSRQV